MDSISHGAALAKNRELQIQAINHLAEMKCVGCRDRLGGRIDIWECSEPLHIAVNEMIDKAVEYFQVGRCRRCGKLIPTINGGVREPGHMTWGGGDFCWSCWHITFDDRS